MNRISAIALFAAASFATLHNAGAQSLLKPTAVPFSFSVNGTTLPAGTYIVTSVTPVIVKISSTDYAHPMTVAVMTSDNGNGNPSAKTDEARLVFENYGGQYFLHEIVSPIHGTDGVIPVSNEEKKARVELASKTGGQPILVAVK